MIFEVNVLEKTETEIKIEFQKFLTICVDGKKLVKYKNMNVEIMRVLKTKGIRE